LIITTLSRPLLISGRMGRLILLQALCRVQRTISAWVESQGPFKAATALQGVPTLSVEFSNPLHKCWALFTAAGAGVQMVGRLSYLALMVTINGQFRHCETICELPCSMILA
jgi:hypothetical protein